MRLTLDIDDTDRKNLKTVCRKGKKLCGKRPDRIYRTKHGFHLIWDTVKRFGRDITEEECFSLRKRLGDDTNRIKLDEHGHRLKQVLFSEKRYKVYDCPEEGDRKLTKIQTSKRIRIR